MYKGNRVKCSSLHLDGRHELLLKVLFHLSARFDVSTTELYPLSFYFETAFHYVVQAGRHLLSAGITGTNPRLSPSCHIYLYWGIRSMVWYILSQVFPLLPPNLTSTTELIFPKTLLLIIHLRLSLRNCKSLRTKKFMVA